MNNLRRNERGKRQIKREELESRTSFEGLHVDRVGNYLAKGAFDLGGILPEVEKNVILIKGWFDQILPTFFAEHPGPIWFISHDADTYEAAKIVFEFTAPKLRPGTVIVFDDYWGYRGWKYGEHKAWAELVSELNIKYDYLALTVQQVFIIILIYRLSTRTASDRELRKSAKMSCEPPRTAVVTIF